MDTLMIIYLSLGLTIYATLRAPSGREIDSDILLMGLWRTIGMEFVHFLAVLGLWPVYLVTERLIGRRKISTVAFIFIVTTMHLLVVLGSVQ